MNVEQHGGNIYKASKKYGIAKDDILDFSANINPLGIPHRLRDIFVSNLKDVENYPDPECMALKNAIANYVGVSTDNIIVGNGASEIIGMLFTVLSLKRVLIPAPTFSEYQRFAVGYGCELDFFILKEQDNFKLDIGKLLENLTWDLDAVLLCNPNNPTSTLINRSDMKLLIKEAKEKGITVIIDEAFIELTDGGNSNSVADLLEIYDNLFIIRAFTKVFAIPGVRLGYGLGNPKIISKMWSMKIPWPVNTFACLVAEFLPQAGEYLQKTQEWLVKEKDRFYNQLCEIDYLHPFKPETNFILIKIEHPYITSSILRDKMLSKGIMIRDASNFTSLDNRFIRVAIKDRESNKRFLATIKDLMGKI